MADIVNAAGTCLAMILGGALGNLSDGMIAGHIADFLDFNMGAYHWPSF